MASSAFDFLKKPAWRKPNSFIVYALAAAIIFILAQPSTAIPLGTGVILGDETGRVLYARQAETRFVPASTLKILTSLAALRTLGPDFRFKTAVRHKGHTLYIKGFGDPLMISETIKALADQIRTRLPGIRIRGIVLDPSYFHPGITIPGTGSSLNPYDATTGALCANFNTIAFTRGPAGFISAEPQTPLLPDFLGQIRSSGLDRGRILLSRPMREIYPGLLLVHFLEKAGVQVSGKVTAGPFPEQGGTGFLFESGFPLETVVQKLLTYSNNFMANQLMLAMGAGNFGAPADLAKGVRILTEFARDQLGIDDLIIAEGSGLSRENRVTPKQMLRVLMAFMPYQGLLRHKGGDHYKTGTLSDVRARAGYLSGPDGRVFPYAIFCNGTIQNYEKIQAKLKQAVKGQKENRLKGQRAGVHKKGL